jgi:hypothetical protein
MQGKPKSNPIHPRMWLLSSEGVCVPAHTPDCGHTALTALIYACMRNCRLSGMLAISSTGNSPGQCCASECIVPAEEESPTPRSCSQNTMWFSAFQAEKSQWRA